MKRLFLSILSMLTVSAVSAQSLGELAARGSSEQDKPASKPAQIDILDEPLEAVMSRAKNGDGAAQLAIGTFYAKGQKGLPQNGALAAEWLAKSAAQNVRGAQLYLGYLYGEGRLLKRDFKKAVLLREAAAKGASASEKWALGNAFLFGFMLPKDFNKAMFWITAAADENDGNAILKLIEIYKKSADAENLAKWSSKFANMELAAAQKGNVAAMAAVARKFMSGTEGLPRERSQAAVWYKRAADLGNVESMEVVAKMYAKGRFFAKNPAKAQYYFEKLAAVNPAYCFKISNLYGEGADGFPADVQKSLEWLERASKSGDVSTRLYLAWRYWRAKNLSKSAQWCDTVVAECQKLAAAAKSENNGKNFMANSAANNEKIAKAMGTAVVRGDIAPDDFNAYCAGVVAGK